MKLENPKEKSDNSYDSEPKVDKLQMSYVIYAVIYIWILCQVLKQMGNGQTANIVYLAMTGIAIVFGLITVTYNRKKEKPAFSWGVWYSASGLMCFAAFLYPGMYW